MSGVSAPDAGTSLANRGGDCGMAPLPEVARRAILDHSARVRSGLVRAGAIAAALSAGALLAGGLRRAFLQDGRRRRSCCPPPAPCSRPGG